MKKDFTISITSPKVNVDVECTTDEFKPMMHHLTRIVNEANESIPSMAAIFSNCKWPGPTGHINIPPDLFKDNPNKI